MQRVYKVRRSDGKWYGNSYWQNGQKTAKVFTTKGSATAAARGTNGRWDGYDLQDGTFTAEVVQFDLVEVPSA